jgi:hypothetical protein
MRIDHGIPAPPTQDPARARSPTVVVVGSPTWESDVDEREGPVFARNTERERGFRYGYSRASQAQAQRDPQALRRHENESEDPAFTLFCGGEEVDYPELGERSWSPAPHEPSILPLYPPTTPSPQRAASVPHKRSTRRSTGCGALLHMHAAPRKRLGVWNAKHEATGAVVGLEPSYFDRSAVAKIVRSACGCVREGVGCAVCGNPLGTRYKPCKTAAEGIFTSRPRPSGPVHPEGPRYWHAHSHPHASSSTSRASLTGGTFYVYTFFATSVTSSPAYAFPPRPALTSHHSASTPQAQTYQSQFQVPLQRQPPQPQQPPQQQQQQQASTLDAEPIFDASIYDRGVTASPTPLSDVGEGEGEGESEGYAYQYQYQATDPYQYQYPPPDAMSGPFDPDGEFIAEPSSPDKTGDAMLPPER